MAFDTIALAAHARAAHLLETITERHWPEPPRASVFYDPRMIPGDRKAPKPERMRPLSLFREDVAEAIGLGIRLYPGAGAFSEIPGDGNSGTDGSRLVGHYEALNGQSVEGMYAEHRRLLHRRTPAKTDPTRQPDTAGLKRFGYLLADLALGASHDPLPGVAHIPENYAFHAIGSVPGNPEHSFAVAACRAVLGEPDANVFDLKRAGFRICGALEAANKASIRHLHEAFAQGSPAPILDEPNRTSYYRFAKAIVDAARLGSPKIGPVEIPRLVGELVDRNAPAFLGIPDYQEQYTRSFPGR